jgi:predicted transcriptional regulator of viral defense system
MDDPRLTTDRLKAAGLGAFFRPRDLEALEIPFAQLQRLVADGVVEKVGPALYRLRAAEPSEFETLAMVASAIPGAIICLLSALAVHGIGTQAPHEVWLALDRKARKPVHAPARLRVVRFSGPGLTYGVESRHILGVPVRLTSPARTVVDCFRYRGKIGLDVALEALRDGIQTRKAAVDEIMRAAEVLRVRTVITPYVEALTT